MTSISAADLTKLREQQQYSTPYLAVLQPDTLLAARVNDAGIARGDRSIVFNLGTGTAAQFARITAGHTLWIGTAAGTYDVGKVRVKSIAGNQVAGTITIAENGIDWANTLYLTIIDFFDIWPIPPRQDGAGVLYKDFSITYTDENEDSYPVPIMGPHRAGFLSGGSLVFTLDGSASYAIASGAAITTYAWTATGGVIANAAIATTTITFSTAGYYWVTLTVTDDNGKSQLTRRCYFVYDNTDTSNQPYRDFTISNCGGDWNGAGWSFSAEVFGNVELSDFPDGTLVLLWHQNYINNSEDYVNIWDIGDEIICAGYLQRDTDSDDLADSGTGSVSFSVESPTLYLGKKSIMGTVALEATASPEAWNEYVTTLSAGRAVHHLLRWHSTVIETCDVIGLTDNTLQVYQVAFTEDSLLDMVNQFAYDRGIFAKLVSAKDGRLYFVEDSNYLDETDRGALDTIMTITAQDLAGTPQLAREPLQQVSLAFMDGFDFDGTAPGNAFTFVIPGYISGAVSYPMPEFWGRGSTQKTRQILANEADGQMKTGRVLALANNPLRELRLDFRSNYLGAIDIIPNVGWYRWGIANATLKRGLSLLNTDWLCRRAEIRFPVSESWPGAIQVSAILEGEAFGPDGITSEYPTSYPTPTLPTPNWDIPVTLATYGYWIGGIGPSDVADRINFSTGVTAANGISDLPTATEDSGSISDLSTFGYWAGGEQVGTVATAYRTNYTTEVTAANANSDRSAAVYYSPGASGGGTYGLWTGGYNGSFQTFADKVTFATGITAANATSALSTAKCLHCSVSDGVDYIYWPGGTLDFLNGILAVERTTIATEATAAYGQPLSAGRQSLAGISDNSTYGYIVGGQDGNAGAAETDADRITFATGVIAANAVSDLPSGRIAMGSASDGTANGYMASQSAFVGDATFVIDFSTGVTSGSAVSNLSTLRYLTTNIGISNGAF